MNNSENYQKMKKFLVGYTPKIATKQNLVDTIAMAAASTPFFALTESLTRGDAQSIRDRVLSLGIGLLINPAIVGVRDFSSNKMELRDEKKDWKQELFDAMYIGAITAAGAVPLYFKNPDKPLTDNLMAIVGAFGVGFVSGPVVGYARDTFSDMFGLKECSRSSYPSLVKNQNVLVKKTIAVGLVAASLALTAGIYVATPDKEQSKLEKTVTQDKPTKYF